MSNNLYYNQWKANQQRQELELWKQETTIEIKTYIDNRINEAKNEIINGINNQVNIYAETFLNGKKINLRDNLTDYIVNELAKSFK